MIPFVDLKTQYLSIKEEIDNAIHSVIEKSAFIKGEFVEAFERNFAAELGMKHCVSVANGTDALYITLKMLGVHSGDEVITVGNSWISTSETISQTGAKPVFVDVERDLFTIDPDAIAQKINSKTKAIIPVHLYGQAANIQTIKDICLKHRLFLIEDCAQAHFTKFNDQFVGTFGDAATFSFYPGKNLGAYGDAGAIVTNNDQLAEKVRIFANHGALKKHHHLLEGVNSRLDGIQAAILNAKLPHIHEWNKKRFENAMLYNKYLKEISEIQTPAIRLNSTHTFHIYAILCNRRDELIQYLTGKQIQTAIHYPVPLPFMPAYSYLRYRKDDFPVISLYMNSLLSLPMFPELTEDEIKEISLRIKEFYMDKRN